VTIDDSVQVAKNNRKKSTKKKNENQEMVRVVTEQDEERAQQAEKEFFVMIEKEEEQQQKQQKQQKKRRRKIIRNSRNYKFSPWELLINRFLDFFLFFSCLYVEDWHVSSFVIFYVSESEAADTGNSSCAL
jgi:DNA polymerase sigma